MDIVVVIEQGRWEGARRRVHRRHNVQQFREAVNNTVSLQNTHNGGLVAL